jgi:hypothetical protein
VHLAALMSLFGTLLFPRHVLPNAISADAGTIRIGSTWCAWRAAARHVRCLPERRLTAASALIAGTGDIAMTLHALPVALQTQFGHGSCFACL